MSLATRCSVCGTVFRVVQDQLKVSEGWVRCGRCEQVFNALEGLFDLEREAPPPWPPDGEPGVQPVEDWRPPGGAPGSVPLPSYPYATPAPREAANETDSDSDQNGFADARFHSELLGDSTAPLSVADTLADTTADTTIDEPAPQFVRQAQRAARWRHPGVRAALAFASLLLGLALAGQVALHFRDGLAAHWPETGPLLEALCEPLDCGIEPLRRVESLAVDSSGLTKLDGAGLYRFSVVLRNRGNTTVMLPAIDLSLTDPQGQLVARKVVSAAELGATQSTLVAGAELALQGVLAGGERRIVGYQVEIFYP
jgi:predicted Zn finger-like uncharacterized protein